MEPGRLAELSFFAGFPEEALARVAEAAWERRIEPEEVLVRQSEEATVVWFLLSGTLNVLVRFEGVGDLFTGVLRDRGTLVGWSCFRAPYRYTASIRAEEASTVLAVPRTAFEDLFAADPRLGYEVLKRVAATVDARLEGALDFLEDAPDDEGRAL